MFPRDVLKMIVSYMVEDIQSCLSLSVCSKRFRSIVMQEISTFITYCYTDRSRKIPSWVTHLYLEESIKQKQVSPSIQSITFSPLYNAGDLSWIPSNVNALTFGKRFNQPLSIIPESISKVRIEDSLSSHVFFSSVVPSHITFMQIINFRLECMHPRCSIHRLCRVHNFKKRNNKCCIVITRVGGWANCYPYP